MFFETEKFLTVKFFENICFYCDGNDVIEATTLDGSIENFEN